MKNKIRYFILFFILIISNWSLFGTDDYPVISHPENSYSSKYVSNIPGDKKAINIPVVENSDSGAIPFACIYPTIQATAFITLSITSTSMTIGWTRGNGTSVLVIAREGNPVNINPSDGNMYPGVPAFGLGPPIGPGNYVVYSGPETSVTVTNLVGNTPYFFAIYEYSAMFCYKKPAQIGTAITLCETTTPVVEAIIQPTCAVPTGSVAFNGLPPTGTWTLTRNPGGVNKTGTGSTTIVSGIPSGAYTFTLAYQGCISEPTESIIINTQPLPIPRPTANVVIQPDCNIAKGVVQVMTPTGDEYEYSLDGLVFQIMPTFIEVSPGSYQLVARRRTDITCISPSRLITVNPRPEIPTAPGVGTITQPTCSISTGSVALSGLPGSGTWTLTRTPDGIITTGTGTSTTVTLIPAGVTYNFLVTNSSGCISAASSNVVINAQPTQTPPSVGTVTHPTCSLSTGSVVLSGLPSPGIWTLTRTPGGTTTTGTGTTTTVTLIPAGTFTYTVTNASGCISGSSSNVVINTQPVTPNAPAVGTITHPNCSLATGSVVLSGLPSSGSWTLTRTPGGTITTGSGISITVTGIPAGTYTYTVTNSFSCTSAASGNVIINTQPPTPAAPVVGTITHPTCPVATGSVDLSGLPSSGSWTLTRTPGGTITTGSGTSTTVTGIPAGTYTYTVTNSSSCTSAASGNVIINTQPPTPAAPVVGTIANPTCSVATGSVDLSGLPSSGSWTLTRTPGGTITTGSGTSTTVTGIPAGTYTYTVTNSSSCTSAASGNVLINTQPATPAAPVVGTITHPNCSVATGSADLSGLPSSGSWTLTRTPGGTITTGSGTSTTVTGIPAGTYTYTVTNSSSCTSAASGNVIINTQPATPTTPIVGTITHPTCSVATGSVDLSGLPSSGSWTLTRTPGGTITTGSGTSATVTGISAGIYTFTVTNSSSCTSVSSSNIVINTQPVTPTAPIVGTIIHPTCSVATGSVDLSGLPESGTWTLIQSPEGITTNGTGTSTTITGISAGNYTYTVSNSFGCISAASGNVSINANPSTPPSPVIGTITQPTCTVATGSVIINGLPATGSWTLTQNPGGINTNSTGTTTTITSLTAGNYTFTVVNSSGCISAPSANIIINIQPAMPATPNVGIITQPSCTSATGSVVLEGLPAAGTWTLTQSPGGITTNGTGTSSSISSLIAGIYTFTVTNSSGCISAASANIVINAQPEIPSIPVVGAITQPTCSVATGSVILSGLPASGTWTLTRSPGGTTTTGTGISTTVTGIPSGTYTYIVTNSTGCSSAASGNVTIATNPLTPASPTIGTINQPTCSTPTGSVALSGLPASGTWTLTKSPGGTTTTGTGTTITVSFLTSGTYSFTVTNSSGCTSTSSANVVINTQPVTPAPPSIGTITHPTCSLATGSVVLNGLPATGTWTLTRTPGGIVVTGSGISTTISALLSGTYTFSITNSSGCVSAASANITINAQPATPTAPAVGAITQPTCSVGTGSVVLNGLPATGSWTLTQSPGGKTTTGTGTSSTISGLPPGTYTFSVTNSGLCTSSSSSNVIINSMSSLPDPTTANPGTNILATGFTITWSAVSTADGYRFDLATDNSFLNVLNAFNDLDVGNVLSYTVTGLSANTVYYCRLRAYNICGSGLNSNIVSIQTQSDLPQTPVATPAANIVQTSFSANWSSSSYATGYYLDVSNSSSFASYVSGYSNKDVSNVTTFSVTGLSANTTYYYRIRAYNSGGTSSNSNIVTVLTLPQAPAAPVAIAPKNTTQTGFTADFNSSSTATGYSLDVSTNSSFTTYITGFNDKDIGNVLTFNITGLTAKTIYYYRVRAYNTGGTSPNSNTITVTTLSSAPSAPTGLSSASCSNQVTLKWRKSNDPYVNRYRIYAGLTSNPTTKIDSATLGVSDTLKVITGLTSGQTYYFRVTAVNNDGPESSYSTQASAKVISGVYPKIKSKFGNLLICSNVGDSILSYQWYKEGSAISKATLQFYETKKSAGSYYVETIDKNGCKNISNSVSISGTKSVVIYPNPASESFSVKMNEESEGKATIRIINTSGIKIIEYQVDNFKNEIIREVPVKELKEGMYTIEVIIDQEELYFTKIMVIK